MSFIISTTAWRAALQFAPVSQMGTSIYKFSIKVVKVKANVDKNQTGYRGTSGNCQISSFNKGNSETDKLEEYKS